MLWDRCLSCLSVSVSLSVTLVYCGQTVGWIKISLGTEVGLGPGDIVLHGAQFPPPRKGAQQSPTFRSMYTVAKRLDRSGSGCHLVRKYVSAQATFVLDGDPAPSPTERSTAAPPHFSAHVYCGQTAEWIMLSLGAEVGLGPGDIVLDGDPTPPTEMGTAAPTFRPMHAVAKRSPISATAELLLG